MLALSFLIMIGMALVGESLGFHVPKGYIYFAMAFYVAVNCSIIKLRKRLAEPINCVRTSRNKVSAAQVVNAAPNL